MSGHDGIEGRRSRAVAYPTAPHDDTTIEAYHVEDGASTAPGLAHRYYIWRNTTNPKTPMLVAQVQFQRGPVGGRRSTTGVFLTHLLAICADMVRQYADLPNPSPADEKVNSEALGHIEAALSVLTARRDARAAAGVLNTMAPTPNTESGLGNPPGMVSMRGAIPPKPAPLEPDWRADDGSGPCDPPAPIILPTPAKCSDGILAKPVPLAIEVKVGG